MTRRVYTGELTKEEAADLIAHAMQDTQVFMRLILRLGRREALVALRTMLWSLENIPNLPADQEEIPEIVHSHAIETDKVLMKNLAEEFSYYAEKIPEKEPEECPSPKQRVN